MPKLAVDLNAGELWGRDRITAAGAKARSRGDVVEADLYFKNRSALVARYDTAKPSNVTGTQTTTAYTFAIAHRPTDYYRVELEFRKQQQPDSNSVIGSFWFFF